MMKIFLTGLFLATFVFFQVGCSGSVSSNNVNSPDASGNVALAESSPAAEDVQNSQPETVPTFTDAGEALAAGSKYLDDNKIENAIEALKQATKLNPDLADAHFKLGIAYSLQENEQKASQEVVEEATPTPAPAKSRKGKKDEPQLLTNSDRAFDNAARAYEKIIKKNPKDDAAFFNLGRAYNKINKDQEAEKALRQAVKLKPDDLEYQTELGMILIKLANYDEAVPILKKVVQQDEGNLQAVDALEKAEAGLKRTTFGIKPKIPAELQQSKQAPRKPSKPKEDDSTDQTPPPQSPPPPTTKPSNQ